MRESVAMWRVSACFGPLGASDVWLDSVRAVRSRRRARVPVSNITKSIIIVMSFRHQRNRDHNPRITTTRRVRANDAVSLHESRKKMLWRGALVLARRPLLHVVSARCLRTGTAALRVPNLRLVGVDGKPLGLMPGAQAIDIAAEQQVELVEVAANADPPVWKLRVMKEPAAPGKKREPIVEKKKKPAKEKRMKEVRITDRCDERDAQIKGDFTSKLLQKGHAVRVFALNTGEMCPSGEDKTVAQVRCCRSFCCCCCSCSRGRAHPHTARARLPCWPLRSWSKICASTAQTSRDLMARFRAQFTHGASLELIRRIRSG